mmetsp:Transcript_100939/g.290267  ORF Transcript_100939/g.290267 Transcript_100939/m.290267 type:complete len:370 (-) Transcript_100939:305-1414(-)
MRAPLRVSSCHRHRLLRRRVGGGPAGLLLAEAQPMVRPPGLRVCRPRPFLPVLRVGRPGAVAGVGGECRVAGVFREDRQLESPRPLALGHDVRVFRRPYRALLGRRLHVQFPHELGRHGLLALLARAPLGRGHLRGFHHGGGGALLRKARGLGCRRSRRRHPLQHLRLPFRWHPRHVPPQLLHGDDDDDRGHWRLFLHPRGRPPGADGVRGLAVHRRAAGLRQPRRPLAEEVCADRGLFHLRGFLELAGCGLFRLHHQSPDRPLLHARRVPHARAQPRGPLGCVRHARVVACVARAAHHRQARRVEHLVHQRRSEADECWDGLANLPVDLPHRLVPVLVGSELRLLVRAQRPVPWAARRPVAEAVPRHR